MENDYFDGDFVLMIKSPFLKCLLKPGRDVVFTQAPYGTLIKRIHRVRKNRSCDLRGLNPRSIPAEQLKNIPFHQIKGVVIHRFR